MRTRYELEHLSTDELLASMHEVLQRSHQAAAELLAHLAEVDRRELYVSLAHPSMFQYAVDELGLSEAEAFMRITAARAARRFPVIFEQVATGALHLTAIKLVAPYLTEENHLSLLTVVSHKSRRDIELELARRFPKEDVPQQLRKLPAARRPVMANSARAELFTSTATQTQPQPNPQPTTAAAPLAEQRYKLQLTLNEETHRKLRTAQQLLRHQVPSGELAAVLDHALDALIDARMKRKYGATKRPRSGAVASSKVHTPRSRYVPNAVKREVLQRDGMQCSFVDVGGRRCSETGGLELHHAQPFAKNGEHSTGNLRLYCRRHNAHAAALDYGAALMEAKRRRPPDRVCNPRATYRVWPAACRPRSALGGLARALRESTLCLPLCGTGPSTGLVTLCGRHPALLAGPSSPASTKCEDVGRTIAERSCARWYERCSPRQRRARKGARRGHPAAVAEEQP